MEQSHGNSTWVLHPSSVLSYQLNSWDAWWEPVTWGNILVLLGLVSTFWCRWGRRSMLCLNGIKSKGSILPAAWSCAEQLFSSSKRCNLFAVPWTQEKERSCQIPLRSASAWCIPLSWAPELCPLSLHQQARVKTELREPAQPPNCSGVTVLRAGPFLLGVMMSKRGEKSLPCCF